MTFVAVLSQQRIKLFKDLSGNHVAFSHYKPTLKQRMGDRRFSAFCVTMGTMLNFDIDENATCTSLTFTQVRLQAHNTRYMCSQTSSLRPVWFERPSYGREVEVPLYNVYNETN